MTSQTQTWSLITVTYNSASKLRQYWDEYQPAAGHEWIVVDNASSDNTVEVARSLGATVIPLPENVGFAAANNTGFRVATGSFVAFVNPDVRVQIEDLPKLAARVEAEDGLVSPQLINDDGTPQPNGRGWPILTDQIRNRLKPDSVRHRYHIYANPGEGERDVIWLTGAVIAGSAKTLALLGPWNEKYFLYYEDVDLCLRARELGIRGRVLGDVRWVHGWARETAGSFRWGPWRRNVSSLLRFYGSFPRLVFAPLKK